MIPANLPLLILALTFTAWVVVDARVFADIRDPAVDWITQKSGTAGYLLTCRVCTGWWISVAAVWWWNDTAVWDMDRHTWLWVAAVNGGHYLTQTVAGLLEHGIVALKAYTRTLTPPTIEAAVPYVPVGEVEAAIDRIDDVDVPGISAFLDDLHTHAPNVTIAELHDLLDQEETN